MKIIIALFFGIVYINANEFANKQIIKLESADKMELIDLGQAKTISKNEKALFDSSKEIKKNEIYLEYEDTDKDFILLAGYNKDLYFEFEDLNVSGEEFVSDIFVSFIEEVTLSRSLELLNKQNNDIYQDLRNFSILTKNPKHRLFDVSSLLTYALSYDRIYNKNPEYVLFIVIDEGFVREEKRLFFTSKVAYINLEYKILKLGENAIIDNKNLTLFFGVPKKKDLQQRYYASTHQAGVVLKKYFSKLAKQLN